MRWGLEGPGTRRLTRYWVTMSRLLSVYLDLVRFLAAVAVFLAHLSFKHIGGDSVPWYLSEFGDVAVAIFFVLSGFVIAHVVATREHDWKSYATSRFSRLYSVVPIALLLTLVLDFLGARLDPVLYADQRVLWKPPSVTGYLASGLLINEWRGFGWGGIAPGSNGPWWSLSFEAAYYVVAGFVLFAPVVVSVPVATLVLAMGGTTVASLFPLWGLGYGLYAVTRRVPHRMAVGIALLAFGAALLLIYPYVSWRIPRLPITLEFGRGNFQRHLLGDYYAAAAFGIHLIGAHMVFAKTWMVPVGFERFSRWVGSMTFPLYLLHVPILPFLAAALPFGPGPRTLTTIVVVFAIVALLTPLCERLKDQLRSGLNRYTKRLARAA